MDKEYMKIIFRARRLPVGPYVVVRERDWPPDVADSATGAADPERKRVLDAITELGWPLFVKPARGGAGHGTPQAPGIAQPGTPTPKAPANEPNGVVRRPVEGGESGCS